MLWAVIMAGGSGTRFWPASRKKTPKQFLSFFGKKTLIEETVDRLEGVIPRSNVIVVTQQDKIPLVKKLLKFKSYQIIGEPVGRNTAPCAALAATMALKRDPNAVIALLPADHEIAKVGNFRKLLRTAHQIAKKEKLPVTFGIKPDCPHTGYGYLERGGLASKKSGLPVYKLKRFHEKPNAPKAKRFLATRRFFWNSGMFVWRADSCLGAVKKYLPDAARISEKIANRYSAGSMKKFFPSMPNISIDYGLMEKLKGKILTIPADIGWSDLGGWQTFSEFLSPDALGNVVKGQAIFVESRGNIVNASKRLVAVLGIEDAVIVDTEDALLVCSKKKTENVRQVVDALKRKKLLQYL